MIRQRRRVALAIVAALGLAASCAPSAVPRDPDPPTAIVASATGVAPAAPPTPRAPARGQIGVGVWGKLMLARPWSLVDESAVQRCYDDIRAADPALAGWLLFRLAVSGSGNVTVELAEREGVPESLAVCTARAVAATTDPPETMDARGEIYVRFR